MGKEEKWWKRILSLLLAVSVRINCFAPMDSLSLIELMLPCLFSSLLPSIDSSLLLLDHLDPGLGARVRQQV